MDGFMPALASARAGANICRRGVATGHGLTLVLIFLQGKGDTEERATNAGRPLRERKALKPCPACKADIADFLAHGQVNRCALSLS
jgi:hypothetical protein